MFLLQLRHFLKTRIFQLSLALVLILGIVSIVIGKQYQLTQQKNIEQITESHELHLNRNLKYHKDDIGLLLYYLEFVLIKPASPLSSINIGQNDINTNVQSVTIRALEGQRHDTDLVNPTSLVYGNLDFGFIILFVFPLIVIAYAYNLRSEEVESGTWRLVAVMSKSKRKFLVTKLLVRVLVVFAMLGFLLALAAGVLSIQMDSKFLAFLLAGLLYQVFWFSICFWIVSLNLNSATNALSLLAIWLTLVILVPASLNSHISRKHPIPEAFTTMIEQRDGYHKKWDSNKRESMDLFFAVYPQYRAYGYPPEEGFNWMWYYAIQHLGDEESMESSNSMEEKIHERYASTKSWAQFTPTMHTQLVFNELSESSLIDHVNFLNETTEFHERTRLYFYPKIFDNENPEEVDWEKFNPELLESEYKVKWLSSLLPLVLAALFFAVIAGFRKP